MLLAAAPPPHLFLKYPMLARPFFAKLLHTALVGDRGYHIAGNIDKDFNSQFGDFGFDLSNKIVNNFTVVASYELSKAFGCFCTRQAA